MWRLLHPCHGTVEDMQRSRHPCHGTVEDMRRSWHPCHSTVEDMQRSWHPFYGTVKRMPRRIILLFAIVKNKLVFSRDLIIQAVNNTLQDTNTLIDILRDSIDYTLNLTLSELSDSTAFEFAVFLRLFLCKL